MFYLLDGAFKTCQVEVQVEVQLQLQLTHVTSTCYCNFIISIESMWCELSKSVFGTFKLILDQKLLHFEIKGQNSSKNGCHWMPAAVLKWVKELLTLLGVIVWSSEPWVLKSINPSIEQSKLNPWKQLTTRDQFCLCIFLLLFLDADVSCMEI